jgi:hypothetical protein
VHAHGCDHVLREEISGHERGHVQPDEIPPHGFSRPATPLRRPREAGTLQTPTNGRPPDPQPQLAQFTDDAPVSPATVFLREPRDELADAPGDLEPADAHCRAPFPKLVDPARIRPWRDDPDDVRDLVAQAQS